MAINREGAHVEDLLERRGTRRFPVREEVRYRVIRSKLPEASGTGVTLDIGSGGILFTTQERLPVGHMVEISVTWPARLDGTCPLQLVAVGCVVRSELGKAALRIGSYEFKTRSANGRSGTSAAARVHKRLIWRRKPAPKNVVVITHGQVAGATAEHAAERQASR